MSTKDDVSNFLQLGAKYELILTGLFDEITQQRTITEEIQSGFRDSQASLKKTSVDFQNATANLAIAFAKQKKINALLSFLSLTVFASNLMIWAVKL